MPGFFSKSFIGISCSTLLLVPIKSPPDNLQKKSYFHEQILRNEKATHSASILIVLGSHLLQSHVKPCRLVKKHYKQYGKFCTHLMWLFFLINLYFDIQRLNVLRVMRDPLSTCLKRLLKFKQPGVFNTSLTV